MSSEHRCEVVEIGEVEKHSNADSLMITKVFGGYPVIFRTGDYKTGDKAVYVPVDSVVPAGDPRWEFLGDHRRIRAKKMSGVFSMGILTPAEPDWQVGECVKEKLSIVVYEPDLKLTTGGDNEVDPGYMPCYTDIESVRKYGWKFDPNDEVIATEKIHGANARYLFRNGRLWVGSRTGIKKEDPKSIWWQAAYKLNLAERLARIPNIAIYGEVYGQVQDLKYGVTGAHFVAFDAFDTIAGKYLDYAHFANICDVIGVPEVPVLYRGKWKDLDKDIAEGQSVLGNGSCVREGFVVKPIKERYDSELGRYILKYHGEGYLTRKEK